MRRTLTCAGALALFLLEGRSAAFPAPATPTTAAQLAAKVVAARKTGGFRLRATLTQTTSGSSAPQVRQLLVEGRRVGRTASMLYRQLWPAEAGGRVLVIEDAGDHKASGFLYRSGAVTPLTSRMLTDRFFDSDLLVEDMAEMFWYWSVPKLVGEGEIGEYHCAIIDFRPPAGTPTAYSLVKVWVSPDLAFPVRAQQFGRDGRMVKQIGLYRMTRVGDARWLPGITTVEPADLKSRTVIEGVKYEAAPQLSAADFTVAAVRKVVQSPD